MNRLSPDEAALLIKAIDLARANMTATEREQAFAIGDKLLEAWWHNQTVPLVATH